MDKGKVRATDVVNGEDTNEIDDVTFLVETQEFDAHRDTLSKYSPVLEIIIEAAKDPRKIVLNDVTADDFEKLLIYIYFKEIEFADSQVAVRIYNLAEKYAVSQLEEQCISYLLRVPPEKACETYDLVAGIPQFHSVVVACEKHFTSYTNEVLMSKCFMTCRRSTVETIIKRNSLNLSSEAYLFDAVINWAKRQILDKSLRDAILPFMPYIKFDFMPQKRLVEAAEDGILTYDELVYFLVRMAKPTTVLPKLPPAPSFARSRDITQDPRYIQIRMNDTLKRSSSKKQVREARKQLSFAIEVLNKSMFVRKFSFLYICQTTEVSIPVTVYISITNRCSHLKFVASMYVTRKSGHFDIYFPRDVCLNTGETMEVEIDLCDSLSDFQGLSTNSVVFNFKKFAIFDVKGVGTNTTMLCLRDIEVRQVR